MKPIIIATITEKLASNIGERLSVLTPLIRLVSEAIALVKTLAPFSLKSNHPIFFLSMLLYNTYLISKVTFSPKLILSGGSILLGDVLQAFTVEFITCMS